MFDQCPGVSRLKVPTLEVKICPQCGEEIELFSTDVSVTCDNCGFVAYNNITSCIQWCKYARQCVGDEMYEKLMAQKEAEKKNGQTPPVA